MSFNPLRDWAAGMQPSASHLNEALRAIRDLQRGAAPSSLNQQATPLKLGKVVAAPAGQTEFTDARYWVRWAVLPQSPITATSQIYEIPSVKVKLPGVEPELEAWPAEVVVNLAELSVGSHRLTVGTPVLAMPMMDAGSPPVQTWVMCQPASLVGAHFQVDLTSTSGAEGPPPTWVYDVYDLSGTLLGGGMTPEWRMFTAFRMSAATKGTAYYSAAGSLVLAFAHEANVDSDTCT
jgi:hypothetical protein